MTILDDLVAGLPHVTVTPAQPLIGAEIGVLDCAGWRCLQSVTGYRPQAALAHL